MPTSSGTSKRDEVGELSKALRALSSKQSDDDRANAQRRSLFRRVLNLVTVNVDASSLFPDVVQAYEDAVRVRKAHAASVFMAVDVVASARGPAAMECYDIDARRGVEYFLNGVDAT